MDTVFNLHAGARRAAWDAVKDAVITVEIAYLHPRTDTAQMETQMANETMCSCDSRLSSLIIATLGAGPEAHVQLTAAAG
jgi:hypothetical protein